MAHPYYTYVRLTFKNGPRELTRMNVRTVDDQVERLKNVNVTLTGYTPAGALVANELNLKFAYEVNDLRACVAAVAFNAVETPAAAGALRIDFAEAEWWGSDPRGFKLDVFVKRAE